MYFIILLLYVYMMSFVTDTTYLGVSENSAWWTCITYNLVHLSFFHLLINSISFYCLWKYIKMLKKCIYIPLMIIIPMSSAVMFSHNLPTVGASAIIYTMIGMFLALFNYKKEDYIRLWILVMLSILITSFSDSINTGIHICSLSLSLIVSLIARRLYEQ